MPEVIKLRRPAAAPATNLAQSRAVLATYQAKLAGLEADLEKLRADFVEVVASGDELAVMREQDREAQLSGKIARMSQTVAIQAQLVEKQADSEQRYKARRAEERCEELGARLVASNEALQTTLEQLLQQRADVLKADHAFVLALDGIATQSTRENLRDHLVTRDFMHSLQRRIQIAAFALSGELADRPLNFVFVTDAELRQQGAHMLSKQAAEYVGDALRRAGVEEEETAR